MPDLLQATLSASVLLLAGGSLYLWSIILGRWRAGRELVPAEPREIEPWTALDPLVVLLLYIGAQVACARILVGILGPAAAPDAMSPERLVPLLMSNALANLVVVALSVAYLLLRWLPFRGDLGFLPRRLGYDARLGALTFVAALAPVFGIQFILTRFYKSEHPIQVLLSEDSSSGVVLLCFLAAVAVAPLTEEFLFRVVLQGWMESIVLGRRRDKAAAAAAIPEADRRQPIEPSVPSTAVEINPPTTALLPDNSDAAPLHATAPAELVADAGPRLMLGPILISSLAFAAVHLGHGPDPIPLFALAIMLGYVYQKTHRIWPSLVVHALLNAWSLIMLWFSLKFGLGD